MRYFILISTALAFSLSLGACGKSDTPTVPIDQAWSDPENNVTIEDDVMKISDGSELATVTNTPKGYVARYRDFNVLYKVPEIQGGRMVSVGFTEWTSEDSLDVRVEFIAPQHQLETYTRNGNVLQLEIINEMTDRQYRELENFLAVGKKTSSVTNNPDGQVLSAMLEANWDEIESVIELSPDKRPDWANFVCGVATACVATKCWFGGLLNTACGVCTSTVAACAVMDAFGWW